MVNLITLTVQQGQASTYNHPCGDLLQGGRRREYLDIAVPLYKALIKGYWEDAMDILQGREHLVRYSITEQKETPLHIAAMGHDIEFVRYLLDMMSSDDLELQNEEGNTAMCLAVISGNVNMVKIMVERNPSLLTIYGSENMTPLHLAAFHGNRYMVTYLYASHIMRGYGLTNDDMDRVLLKCIQADIFDVAIQILEDNEELPQDEHLWDMLHVLAQKRWGFHENGPRYLVLISMLSRYCYCLIEGSINATPLLRLLWKRIMKKPKDVIDEILRGPMIQKDEMETYPSQILFTAAKMNNRQFLVELIREYPDLIWKRNDDGQTIFHISTSHRYNDIYCLLYEIGSMKNKIAPVTDKEGNNILHLVGKKPEKYDFGHWAGTPFQMFSELLWYKEVEGILPPSCRQVKNTAGETPQELFTENHKKLVSEGMKSITDTINISVVVAALICTIGFSVVFQIPGGFNQNNGFPMFLHNNYFIAFVVLNAISFLLSTSSIILFISIILSRPDGNMRFLLQKWVAGHLALLGSILSVVCAFIINFFIIYNKSKWVYVIYGAAYPVIVSYTAACMSILLNALRAGYATESLFDVKDHTLFD